MLVSFDEINFAIVVACVIICLHVCLYNIHYAKRKKSWERRRQRLGNAMFSRVSRLLLRGKPARAEHYMTRQLKTPEKLIAARYVHDEREKRIEDAMQVWAFDEVVRRALPGVLRHYARADMGEVGYLVEQLGFFKVRGSAVNHFLLGLMEKSSIRMLVIAVNGIALTADEQTMQAALKRCGEKEIACSDKLITDALMQYQGNRTTLDAWLGEHIRGFREGAQRAIILYWTQRMAVGVRELVFDLLCASATPKEARIAAVLYFGAVYDERAMHVIIGMLEGNQWEVNVNCAKALRIYVKPEVTEILHRKVQDANWYVRYNCAMSLVEQDEDSARQEMERIVDPFAKDIIAYALEQHEKKGKASIQPEDTEEAFLEKRSA